MCSMIEQQVPIPILYTMGELTTGANNNRNPIEFKSYVRDNFHLASQSKLINDSMNQTESNRNLPLILFVGSDNVSGKSSMLKRLFKDQHFNTPDKSNPLHKSSIDLVYLPAERLEVNYHVIDVHGGMFDPLFDSSTNGNNFTRFDAVGQLASLTRAVVLQVHVSDLNKNVHSLNETKPFTIQTILNNKCKDVIRLYKEIDVCFLLFCFCFFLLFLLFFAHVHAHTIFNLTEFSGNFCFFQKFSDRK